MKIYECPGFPNPIRIRIALKEKGLTDRATFQAVDVPAGEHQTAAFRAKNPTGLVPALELPDGTVIAESTAITEYIDQLDGEPTLTGRTPQERAVIAMMQRRAEAGLLDAVGAYFHHATEGLGPDIEGRQCAEWGQMQRDRALDTMAYLDTVLADRPFIAGDRFTIADITAYAGLYFAAFAKIDVPETLTNLRAWHDRMKARPSIAA